VLIERSAGTGGFPPILSAHEFATKIKLTVPSQLVGKAPTNLISIFDAGWTHHADDDNLSGGYRVAPPYERSRPYQRGLLAPRDLTNILLNIGYFSLYEYSISARRALPNPPEIETEFPALEGNATQRIHGVLTYTLLEVLHIIGPRN